MIFDFSFWRYAFNQQKLIHNLKEAEMRKFGKRLMWILAIGVLVFAIREFWGMGTVSLTPLLSVGLWETYTVARWTSLLGTLLWAGLYLAFHTYIVAFLFKKLARMPWRAAIVMQAYVTALLVFEKALLLAVFAAFGYTLSVSFLSFGPLAATFLEEPFLVLFFNQLTVITAAAIALQYKYVRSFTAAKPWAILLVLIAAHVAGALIVAYVGLLPLADLFAIFVEEGGVPVE
ncbi:hypothetical protein [Indiicoccus explosivorum]|uniref:hypothetical protein n=1 Tax=Indiicoccus explosivorum TaxID=1917864 RepID=UPI001F4EF809|nr:hypothetical protein [Indiicoccus explosivorum]